MHVLQYCVCCVSGFEPGHEAARVHLRSRTPEDDGKQEPVVREQGNHGGT